MNYDLIIKETEAYIKKYMRRHGNPKLVFHNLHHTQNVVFVTSQIAKNYSLEEKDFFIVMAAAWFLDVGYFKDISQPEETSIKMAEEYFGNYGIATETIEAIKKCIPAPATAESSGNLLTDITHDAATFYFGTENFSSHNKLKRKEAELLCDGNVEKNDWNREMINMLATHEYFTDYCKTKLTATKMSNLQKLKKKNPLAEFTPNAITTILEREPVQTEKKDKKESKTDSPDRTIETMFRTTTANSQRLSAQADTKAHIMISVNTIIVSLLLSIVVRKIETYSNLTLPVMMILIVNLVTIIFSILATRPTVANTKFTESDFRDNKANLLFFGNFYSMPFDEFSSIMLDIMKDKQTLYIALLRNYYEQGVVLAKKYRMLKISYNVFMYGLVVSVIAFYIASKYFSEPL
jgi:hypothetical protein